MNAKIPPVNRLVPRRAAWLAVLVACCVVPGVSAAPLTFKTATKRATENFQTEEGRKYFEAFDAKIAPALAEAMKACLVKPDTTDPAEIIFIISAKGKVTQVLSTPGIPFVECIAAKMRATLPAAVPPPPADSWAVGMLMANHFHAGRNAPPDRPQSVKDEQVEAMEKAIAPYIAKALATYPGAKKRFLEGLPPKHQFFVWTRLYQMDEQKNVRYFEDVFVTVRSIQEGIVTGTIANDLNRLTNYRNREEISFPESKIRNWLIVRPDGSEEGNEVGKFLDTYKP